MESEPQQKSSETENIEILKKGFMFSAGEWGHEKLMLRDGKVVISKEDNGHESVEPVEAGSIERHVSSAMRQFENRVAQARLELDTRQKEVDDLKTFVALAEEYLSKGDSKG